MRRKKDQKSAAKKSEAAHKEKMAKLEARTQNNLKRLDKMRKRELVLATKRKAAESNTFIAPNKRPKTDSNNRAPTRKEESREFAQEMASMFKKNPQNSVLEPADASRAVSCHICDKLFKSDKNVKDHIRRVHKVSAAGLPMAASKTRKPKSDDVSERVKAAFKTMRESDKKIDAMVDEENQKTLK